MPKGVIIGVGSHYVILPLVALFISRIFNFPSEITAGIILTGCVSSGLVSKMIHYISHANLSLASGLALQIGKITTIVIAPAIFWFFNEYNLFSVGELVVK